MHQRNVVSLPLRGYADKPAVTFNLSRMVSEKIPNLHFHMTVQLSVQL